MKRIAIVLLLLALGLAVFAVSPGMVRGVMYAQWLPFQTLPIDTYAERLWALAVLVGRSRYPSPSSAPELLWQGFGLAGVPGRPLHPARSQLVAKLACSAA
jgi:hypothetical protein